MPTRLIRISLVATAVLLAQPAFAMDLHEARSKGLIGEKTDGYAQAIQHSPDTDALVAEINAKRKAAYAKIAKGNGQAIDTVGKVAAQEIINGLESGDMYQTADGQWKKR